MQGQSPEETGLSAEAVRQALAKAEGVYADIRRGLPMTENAAIRQAQGPERSRGTGGPLSLTALSNSTSQAMAEKRVEARKGKNWTRADELKDQIAELGYTVQDTPQGPVLIGKKDA